MSDSKSNIGAAAYGGAPRSRAGTVLSAIRRKVTLKTELALETARVQQLLPTLTADEHSELCAALAAEDFKLDQDTLHATSRLEAQWHSSGSTFIATTKEDLRL